ncbi:MAG: GNAT family protein [Alphaproteobacteria bacterium]
MIGFLKTGVNGLPPVRVDATRVYLRPPKSRDWQAWARLREQSREFLTPWEPSWPADALSRAAFVRRLRRHIAEWRGDEGYNFMIVDKADEAVLGGIGISNVRRGVAQTGSLGYWIGRLHANRGYMTEAAHAAVTFGFSQLGLHRIEAACIPANVASVKLLERVGFVQEGHAREFLRIDGRWQDHLLYAILREDVDA